MAGSLKKHVGGRIRAARKDAGLTQDQLAGMVDKSVETISNLERGHTAPSLETLGQIAIALKHPLDWFLRGYPNRQEREAPDMLRAQIEVLVAGMSGDELRQVTEIAKVIRGTKTTK